MSEVESQFVKRGLWTNLDKGPVMGRTITTDIQTGTFIIALLAIFTSLGLRHLFNIVVFFYHQVRADGHPNDGHFRQQQVLLRTLPTPSTLIADSIKLWFVWKGVSEHAFRRSLKLTILAAFFAIGTLAAGVFSSYVIDSTDLEVLVSSPSCAHIDPEQYDLVSGQAHRGAIIDAAESYAIDCFNKTSSLPARCRTFTRPMIELKKENVSCPFADGLCSSPAVAFDSGLVEIGNTFGLNIPAKHRVKYRKRQTCAMLSQEGRVRHINASQASDANGLPNGTYDGRSVLPTEEFLVYSYGTLKNSHRRGSGNSTFVTSLLMSNSSKKYTMRMVMHYSNRKPNSGFTPIPELMGADADTSLRQLTAGVTAYYKPVNDPMFAAHKPMMQAANSSTKKYMADRHATFLGCTEQYQYCAVRDSKDICSPLAGVPLSLNLTLYPNATQTQLSLMKDLIVIGSSFPSSSAQGLKALRLNTGYSNEPYSIPDDQWIQEIGEWEATFWAVHQLMFSEIAIGPKVRDAGADAYTQKPATEADRALCDMQKMRKTGHLV